jgi:hypothetical protein
MITRRIKVKNNSKNIKKIKLTSKFKKNIKKNTHYKVYRGGLSSDTASSNKGQGATAHPRISVSSRSSDKLRSLGQQAKLPSSPKAASPKAVPPSSPKFEQQVVPVSKLKGRGRGRSLSYHANIHSQGDSVPASIEEGLANKVRDVFDLTPSPDSATKRKRKILERRIRASTPPPPPVELSPRGRGLLTSYTPELDIVEDATRVPILGNTSGGTAPGYQMKPFVYRHSRPLPLSFLFKKQASLKSKEQFGMLMNIERFPSTYKFLSPIIYDILKRINKRDLFGKVLVSGKLRDELMECINMTSIEAMESRLFMPREDAAKFMHYVHGGHSFKQAIGPTPQKPFDGEIYGIDVMTPDSSPPPPTSLQVIGYDKHPIFRTQRMSREEEMKLIELSDRHAKINGEDYALILAHGSIANVLSPEIQVLANKYLRIIEVGKAGQIVSVKYQSFALEINEILRNPKYHAMFDNNIEGAKIRNVVFSMLCPYFTIDGIELCTASNTFNLTNITHDREFSGDVIDSMIKENHKITYKSIRNKISMGLFLPVDHNIDKSNPRLAKKEIFKLYPGTSFFSTTTRMRLIETLLPLAIEQNRRINIIIMSCAVNYTQGDDIYDNYYTLANPKPGDKNPAIQILTVSKKYLSKINKMMDEYILAFYTDGFMPFSHSIVNGKDVFTGYRDFNKDNKYTMLFTIAEHVISFYRDKFEVFIRSGDTSSNIVDEMFSFSIVNERRISNMLVESVNKVNKLQNYWFDRFHTYIDEMIKVKIFTMNEFKDICSQRIIMIKTSLDIILENLRDFRIRYGSGPQVDASTQKTCDMLDEAIRYANIMFDYFARLESLLGYIVEGLSDDASNPNSFLDYKKYVDLKKEYDETAAKEFYEEMVEDLDYDRYEGETVGFGERLYKTRLANPLPPHSQFRKTERYQYKHKVLPNYDEVRKKRKTMKKKLYDDLRVGKHARKAKRSSGVSI